MWTAPSLRIRISLGRFDPFATPSVNDGYLREADGRSRRTLRIAAVEVAALIIMVPLLQGFHSAAAAAAAVV